MNRKRLALNKNIIAIFTAASLIGTPLVASESSRKMTAYYENSHFNICQSDFCAITITKEQLENLLASENDNLIEIKIEDTSKTINKNELTELKKMAEKSKRQENEACLLTIFMGGLVGTTIAIKESIREKIKKKEK